MRFLKLVIVELWSCFLLSWKYRRFRYARVFRRAEACYRASDLVAEMRGRYPGERLFWSFSINHVVDSDLQYLAVWRVVAAERTGVVASMVFHGPCEAMRQLVSAGHFNPVFAKVRCEDGIKE